MPVQVGVGLSVSLFPLGRIGVTGATPGDPDAPDHDLAWGASTEIVWGASTVIDWPGI